MRNIKAAMKALDARSVMPMQNRPAIEAFLAGGRPVTFFNWECPPRFLDRTPEGREFVNYDLDLEKIFQGRTVDEFTELPRVVEHRTDEVAALRWLQELGIPFRFVKLVADTNAWYLTPESLDILGENLIRARFAEFARRISECLESYPGQAGVALFSETMLPYQRLYDDTYKKALAKLKSDPDAVLDPVVWQQQLERTRHHMGMADEDMVKEFASKTVASYGAEGMVLDRLSQEGSLRQAVWLNNHEVDERTVVITNFWRDRMGIDNLPMLFVP